MVVKEPLVQAVTTLAVTLFIADSVLHPFSFSRPQLVSIVGVTVFVGALAGLITWLFYKTDRDDRIASLTGETVRGMSVPIGKVPQQRPSLAAAGQVSDLWFSNVPEITDAQARDGMSAVAFWNQWCAHHEQHSAAHVRLAKTVLQTIAYRPTFPAAHDTSYHGGRSLLSHSLLVAFYCHKERNKYQFTSADMRGVSSRDKDFTFDRHRDSPLILLIGLAHDIGKLLAYREKADQPGQYEILSDEHDRMGIVVLSRMEAWWQIPTADRDTLTAVIGHYHAERHMPINIDNRAIDDLRHALVYLLIKADTKAGASEASYKSVKAALASSQPQTQRSSARPASGLTVPAPTTSLPTTAAPAVLAITNAYAPVLAPAPAPAHVPAPSPVAVLSAPPPSPLDMAYDRLADAERRIDDAASPVEIKAARSSHIRSVAAVSALTNSSTLLDMFCRLLFLEKNINCSGAIGYRVDDKQRQRRLLFVVEPTLRPRMVALQDCPSEHKGEFTRGNSKSLSPISLKLLAAVKAKGWLWNPMTRSTESANESALYPAYVVRTKGDVFSDRANHVLTEAWKCPSPDKDAPKMPAGFFLCLDDKDPLIGKLAALPEYEKLLVAAPSIFGPRGNRKERGADLPAVPVPANVAIPVANTAPSKAQMAEFDDLMGSPSFDSALLAPSTPSVAAKPTEMSCYSSQHIEQLEKISMLIRDALMTGETVSVQGATTSAALAFDIGAVKAFLGPTFNDAINLLPETANREESPVTLGKHGENACLFLRENIHEIA